MTNKPSLWEKQIKAQIRRRYTQQAAAGGLHENAADSMRNAGYPQDWIDQLPDALIAAFSGCGCPLGKSETDRGGSRHGSWCWRRH